MANQNEEREAMEVEISEPQTENINKESLNTVKSDNSVMAVGAIGSVTCSLHPLVIMNISDHWTRTRAQADGVPSQVYGALIGKQKGRNIEIMNSFELVVNVVGTEILVDREYYNKKEDQFKQVFSDMDFIGWYTTGEEPDHSDIQVHKQICQIYESPIMLKLHQYSRNIDELPLSIHESVIDLINGEATVLFVPLIYTLATEEAERIGVDHVARMSDTGSGECSLVAEHLTAQHNAVKMLYSRVRILLEYMRAVQNGTLPRNNEILSEAFSLCHRLPIIQEQRFRQEFYNQCNDVGLITYLGALTKSCNDLNQFVTKFNILHERPGSCRRLRNIFF